jgi:hypothetical protein
VDPAFWQPKFERVSGTDCMLKYANVFYFCSGLTIPYYESHCRMYLVYNSDMKVGSNGCHAVKVQLISERQSSIVVPLVIQFVTIKCFRQPFPSSDF